MTKRKEFITLLQKHPESKIEVYQILNGGQRMSYGQAKAYISQLTKEEKFRLCQILKV